MKTQRTLDSFIEVLKAANAGEIDLADRMFPRALARAIEFYSKKTKWRKYELIEFLEANKDLFEKIYRTERFLQPFPIEFHEVSSRLQQIFIIMAKRAGIRNPGDYIFLSEQKRGFGYCDAVVLMIPISRSETHLVAVTTRSRKWYIPPSKANQNLGQLVRQIKGVKGKVKREMKKAMNETLVLIGRYTKGVRGAFERKGLSKSKRAILVFDDRNRNWFILFMRFLQNLFSKRLSKLVEKLEGKQPYGEVAERINFLSSYLSIFKEFERMRMLLS
ncbi:MAG: hypothetical protein QXD49_04310 [Archaeoglobaceae archaeon]